MRKCKKKGDEMSQNNQIKAYLDNGGTLTPLKALSKFGVMRLAARIADLKELGMNISTEMVKDTLTGKRYAKYMKVV